MLGATYGNLFVVAQTAGDCYSLFFVGLEAALILVCRHGCEAIPERFTGLAVFVGWAILPTRIGGQQAAHLTQAGQA